VTIPRVGRDMHACIDDSAADAELKQA